MRAEIAAPLLEMENVSMLYHTPQGETAALSDLSLQLEKGAFLAIVGPSGCGKSTILSLIAGLLRPSSGEIRIAGEPVGEGIPPLVGYMLQHDHLFPWCTLWDNVLLGLKIRGEVKSAQKERVAALLEQYGLAEFRNSLPRHLSGGMRQRAALIRTLALEPELLLLDEPFSALDYQTRLRVSDDIGTIIRSRGKTAVLVTHDISEAISMADRVLVLSARPGQIRYQERIFLSSSSGRVLEKRQAPEFAACFDRIWKELNEDA
ncbi:MAG: ABC transporter ATP-binding protein [Bacillota bacterium]|nr:ABC transporter ATP-binding protein [Bacillota bacterium]